MAQFVVVHMSSTMFLTGVGRPSCAISYPALPGVVEFCSPRHGLVNMSILHDQLTLPLSAVLWT